MLNRVWNFTPYHDCQLSPYDVRTLNHSYISYIEHISCHNDLLVYWVYESVCHITQNKIHYSVCYDTKFVLTNISRQCHSKFWWDKYGWNTEDVHSVSVCTYAWTSILFTFSKSLICKNYVPIQPCLNDFKTQQEI